MGTNILDDIHNDLKLLITAITGFENSDQGFRICERFVLSNIKHHRYLSIDSHATKRALEDVTKKFSIHGKYEVAKKFEYLVKTFLTSFDFEQHPQYDLQWSLLCLLLNLSNETNKSDLKSLSATSRLGGDETLLNFSVAGENSKIAEQDIDWGEYLREGQEDFFNDYRSNSSSSSDNELSENDEEKRDAAMVKYSAGNSQESKASRTFPSSLLLAVKKLRHKPSTLDKLSRYLADEVDSRYWLDNNVQNTWWNELEWRCCETDSQFIDAHLCDLWNKSNLQPMNLSNRGISGTISEYQACRELVWMFSAPSQMAIFNKTPECNFSVRDNVSIPSLTPNAFSSILTQYCEFYKMINEMKDFGKNLYQRYDSSNETNKLPPLTYEEYNSVILQHIVQLGAELLEIEKKLMKQDDCHTFLTLSRELEKYTKSVKMIYDIHRAVIIDWKKFPNWICATKLLSGLYQQVQNSSSRQQTNLCASIYLSCLTVYFNIMATWFSEGRLEDWRSEFIIARIPDVEFQPEISTRISRTVNVTEEKSGENFTIRQLDEACLEDPVINLLSRKARHMGRSIELLITLNRISDMWKMNAERDAARISFNDQFLNEITLEFSKYNYSDSADTIDAIVVPLTKRQASMEESQIDIDDNIIQQISMMDNPFLMKAFEEYLPRMRHQEHERNDINEMDSIDGKADSSSIGWGHNIFCKLEEISPTAVLPFRKVLENTLEKVIDQRYSCASKMVKNILSNEYKLETHLRLMRSVYMMERGHIMTQFYRLMFNEIESTAILSTKACGNGGIDVENSLTSILQQVLSQEWPDTSSSWSITVEPTAIWKRHQVLQAVDHLTLHYSIGWPINMVLNENSLVKYNAVFRFQLKLKWALWTLNNLRFRDLEERDGKLEKCMNDQIQHFNVRRLESLRFWLLHAIGSIHAYLAGQVLQGFGIALDRVLAQADNLDTIITVHNEYLEKVDEHCLQTVEFEDLMLTINNLLGMCIHVRERWKRGASALLSSDLDLMEKSYTKYHTYIALALHNAVEHKDADYHKLTPSSVCTATSNEAEQAKEHLNKNNDQYNTGNLVTDLSRDLLTEVAHQSLPPSGIPIPVPTLVQKTSNYYCMENGMEPKLPEYVSLNQYDQTFSYIRWYHYEQNFLILKRSPYDPSIQLAQFIRETSEDCQLEKK